MALPVPIRGQPVNPLQIRRDLALIPHVVLRRPLHSPLEMVTGAGGGGRQQATNLSIAGRSC
jgi:hypothetical protein